MNRPLRYIVRHFIYHADSATPETVVIAYNCALDSLTPANQRGVTFTPFSLSCAVHTASRHCGEVFADFGKADYTPVKSYLPKY